MPDRLVKAVRQSGWEKDYDRYKDRMEERVNYYFSLRPGTKIDISEAIKAGDFKFPLGEKQRHSQYFFDLYPYVRHADKEKKMIYLPGDIREEAATPTFVKSRPVLTEAGSNSVVCRMDSMRHFQFLEDPTPLEKKKDRAVFRNVVGAPWRLELLKRWHGHPMMDFGQINESREHPEYVKPFMSKEEQLGHKFIMCIEGNDVATNLKWVMSSNSIAVMPRPKVETWYMEGKLRGGEHYIEIRDDYEDLEEKLDYYLSHPAEMREIGENAREWTRRFRDIRLEKALMREVVRRYFSEDIQP